MAFAFHGNDEKYFRVQYENSKNNLIPYVHDFFSCDFKGKVLEVGCNLGGNLGPFMELGWETVGIDLNPDYIEGAKSIAFEQGYGEIASFEQKNIFDISSEDTNFKFDLIILKDVIEHVEYQQLFIQKLESFLAPQGKLLIAFPPWSMPFGGHQQGAKSWWLSRGAFIHLLPMAIYLFLFKLLGEDKEFIDFMKETKERGLSIESFENMIASTNLKIIKEDHFFVAPIYEIKFGLKPRLLWTWLNNIPLIRNFYTTSSHYLFESSE
jgi:2-polyprenyl-3-methyl-5-hydroxy-6-metoxy-1,4-benzoquinol methylase